MNEDAKNGAAGGEIDLADGDVRLSGGRVVSFNQYMLLAGCQCLGCTRKRMRNYVQSAATCGPVNVDANGSEVVP